MPHKYDDLVQLVDHFGSCEPGDPEGIADAVSRLRTFLEGCSVEARLVDWAARLLVDRFFEVGAE